MHINCFFLKEKGIIIVIYHNNYPFLFGTILMKSVVPIVYNQYVEKKRMFWNFDTMVMHKTGIVANDYSYHFIPGRYLLLRIETKFDHSTLPFLLPHRETVELIAAAFEKERIFREVPIAECKELAGTYIELMIDVIGVASHLSQLRAHNQYTFRHAINVARISGLIGRWLGYTGEILKDLILAGLLHDIGKILILSEILDKPGTLTTKEMDVVKKHSAHGYDLVKGLKITSDKVNISILQHHERLDGSGYPFGLSKDKISVFARIIAIADVYDAMTSERVYRKKMPPFVAADVIAGDMCDKLDPDIVLPFLARIRDYLKR